FSSSANYFSGNRANAKIIAQAIPNARSSGYVYSYPTCIQNSRAFATATATAYGGAIANCSGDLIFSGSANYFSDNCANANVIAVASGFATAIAYGGAIAHSDGVLKLNKASFDGNYANVSATAAVRDTAAVRGKAYGGAIAANNSILNLTDVTFSANSANATAYGSPSSVVSAYSTASVTAYGGAVYISNSTMEYVVTENECIENIGNNAQKGGFIYLDGVSEATFKVDGSLIVGDSTGMDSIAGSETSTIIKTGSGKWTVNSDISEFTGYWNLNEGILKLDRIARDITLDNWTIGVDAELHLSELNDSITMNVDKKIGTIDLGGGSDTIDTGGYHLSDGLLRISTLTLTGGGRVSSEITNRTAGAGFDLILDDVTLNSIITGGSAADKITITQSSTIGGVLNLGNGANTITANSGTETVFAKSVILGTGADTLTFSSVVFQDSLTLGNGKNSFSAEDSAKISGAFSAGTGDDTLSFNSVEFGNSADLGDGVNSLTATGNAKFSGTLSGGSGDDTFDFSSVTFNRNVNLGDGTNKLTATTAIINGNLTAGSGNDTINLKQNSELHGNIALGGGKNYIYVTQNLTITDGFTLDSDGETHLIVYNNASLSSNSLNVYDPENSNMVSVTYDWSDVEGLDKVRLLVSSDATFETFEFTVELYNQSKEFTLNVSDNYFIQFQAQDEDGWSHRILDDTEAPDQVTGFTMDGTTALWSDTHDNWGGNGVKQYNIQVSSDANFNSVIGSFTATDNSYDFSSFADGNYFIRIQAEDYTGNKGDWSDAEKLLIDNNAPTKPANVTGKVSLDSITVNWSPASDSGSGLKEYKIEFSTSSTFSSITHSATLSGTSYTASDLADGTYYFRVSAVDNVNNVSAWSTVSSVIVDTTAPQAASNVKATQNSGIVTLSWDAASDAGVGVKEYIIEYSTDNSFSSITGTRTVSGTSCSINGLADGNYCFRVQAVDKNGNAASWSNTATVIVDSVPPAKPTASADITSATNKDVTVSAVFSSDSVVKEYSMDNRNWYAYSSGVVMSDNGTVYFRGKDEAGNYSAVTSYEVINIDKVAPTFDISRSTESLTNQNVILTVSAKDSASGIKSIQYSFNNSIWMSGSTVNVDSNKTVYFKVTDNAGNVTEHSVVVNNIDKTAPAKPTASADITSATNKDVTVSAVFSSDSVDKEYSLDNRNWYAYTSGVVMSNNGTVYFRGKDEAGNYSAVTSYEVTNIDKVAPTKPEVFASTTAPTNKNVTVSAEFSLDSIKQQFSYDNQTWYDYESGIVLSRNGVLYFRGIDAVGNVSEVAEYTVDNIDKIAPSAPSAFADVTTLTNNPVTVSAAFSNDSDRKQYSFDGYTWSSYTSGVVMESNGTVYFRSFDAAGNVSEITEYIVENIDNIAPAKPTATADITTATNQNVTVSAVFSSDSVVKQYSFDNKTWKTYSSSVVMESNGSVYFRSFDAAGNVSEITEYIVENIDNIAPAKPTATADITAETEDAVTITATFSRDSVVKQYSLDNKNWQNYTSGIVMESNGTVYFRGIDAAGNVSAVTAYEVNNIIAVSDVIGDDLDGNGLADVILVHTKQGYSGAWLTTGTTSVIKWGSLSNVNAGTEILGTGTLYGSGNDGQDIFFADSKSVGAWNVVDGKVTGYKSVMSINSTTNVLGLGDFNGDGATDILLRSTNGDLGYYNTDGTGFTYLKGLGKEWKVAAIGDLNGDGVDDVVLRHDAGFAGTFLTQENGTVKWASLDTLKSDMDIIGTGDFNGDGVDDVLLQNKSNGWVGAWLVEDGRVDSFIGLCTNKNTIEQIADFNGDGIDDLRIRAGADIGVLYVNGADDTTWQYFKSVGTEWDTSFSALA
ncbi:MAG: fibronectin type III domain-containing protein, partial [Lentisphaeria bacterium]|nr:fibronectin type III domain-containing protein [Lentisphaeria bacterium]